MQEKNLKETINTYIPCGDIPHNIYITSRPCLKMWYGLDSYENHQKKPHPEYGANDIEYSFNSYGYRCPEFDEEYDFKILSLGCSFVLGCGINKSHTFTDIIASKFDNSVNWNLGRSGTSNDHLSRILIPAVEKLKPDIVLINFCNLNRREYISATGNYLCYNPAGSCSFQKEISLLVNEHDNIINFYRNYKLVESFLELNKIEWFWSTADRKILDIEEHLMLDRFAGILERIDLARDWAHPGRKSNLKLSEEYMGKIKTKLIDMPL